MDAFVPKDCGDLAMRIDATQNSLGQVMKSTFKASRDTERTELNKMGAPEKRERVEELRGELREIEREKAELLNVLRELEERETARRREIEEIEEQVEEYTIFVDDIEHKVEQKTMSGAAIKALAGKDASYQLFEEHEGRDDEKIADHESVRIHNGMHFYTVPPATFGIS